MGIYIKIILSGHVINSVNLELSNSEKNILRIEFKGIMVFVLEIKYY